MWFSKKQGVQAPLVQRTTKAVGDAAEALALAHLPISPQRLAKHWCVRRLKSPQSARMHSTTGPTLDFAPRTARCFPS